MPHFYERNITEIKNEYTIFLVNVLSPLLYEGIMGLYKKAVDLDEKLEEAKKKKPDIVSPGVLKLFQKLLANIPNLNNHRIESETALIRDSSKIADIFDDLIRAVAKSNIVLLTYNASGKTCTLVKDRYHENIDVKDFIHKCYIECAKSFYNYPEIFWHKYANLDIQRNRREAHNIIKKAIHEAIRKIIPMKLILEEYLSKDYMKEENVVEDIGKAEYMNIKNMLVRDLYGKDYKKVLVDSHELSTSDTNKYNDDSDTNRYSEGGSYSDKKRDGDDTDIGKLIMSNTSDREDDKDKDKDRDEDRDKDKDESHKTSHKDEPRTEEKKDRPPTKDVNLEFMGRKTAASRMFQKAIFGLQEDKDEQPKEVPKVPVKDEPKEKVKEEVIEKREDKHEDEGISISRRGSVVKQKMRSDDKRIKKDDDNTRSEAIGKKVNSFM